MITPVHKKGSTSDPNNFRPISLAATCCKVMERITNNKLLTYLLSQQLITKQQHGFIKKKSVASNLPECLEDWSLSLQSKHITDVIFVDFKKAFDTVCHRKLRSYGIYGNLFNWIQSFLLGRSQSVRHEMKSRSRDPFRFYSSQLCTATAILSVCLSVRHTVMVLCQNE